MADDRIVIEGADGHTYEIPSDALSGLAAAAAGKKKGDYVFGVLTIRTDDGVVEIPMDDAKRYRKK